MCDEIQKLYDTMVTTIKKPANSVEDVAATREFIEKNIPPMMEEIDEKIKVRHMATHIAQYRHAPYHISHTPSMYTHLYTYLYKCLYTYMSVHMPMHIFVQPVNTGMWHTCTRDMYTCTHLPALLHAYT